MSIKQPHPSQITLQWTFQQIDSDHRSSPFSEKKLLNKN
jgi:hypothetical protein